MSRVNFPSTDNYEKWDEWGQAFLRAVNAAFAFGATNIGQVSDFRGTEAPNGWLKCDGTTFSAVGYPELYITLGNSNILPNLTSPHGAGFIVGIKAA